MKKIFTLVLMAQLLVSSVFAVGNQTGVNDSQTGNVSVEPIMAQNQQRLINGTFALESGQRLQLKEHVENVTEDEDGLTLMTKFRAGINKGLNEAKTKLQLYGEQVSNGTQLKAMLSNGKEAMIKVMPDVAAKNAMEKLRLNMCNETDGCQIELKEVGKGNQTKAVYEVATQRMSRVLGLFKARMNVEANVDAETGEVMNVKKPWWAFIATEPADEDAVKAAGCWCQGNTFEYWSNNCPCPVRQIETHDDAAYATNSEMQCPDADGYYDEDCPGVAEDIAKAFE